MQPIFKLFGKSLRGYADHLVMPVEAPKILFVDDDVAVLDAFRRGLRKHFIVDTARSAEEALQRISAGAEYAVVVSDLRMPGMSGIEFLARLIEIAPTTVRLALTAATDSYTEFQAMERAQVFRLLNKPCDRAVLLTALYAALDCYVANYTRMGTTSGLPNGAVASAAVSAA